MYVENIVDSPDIVYEHYCIQLNDTTIIHTAYYGQFWRVVLLLVVPLYKTLLESQEQLIVHLNTISNVTCKQ